MVHMAVLCRAEYFVGFYHKASFFSLKDILLN